MNAEPASRTIGSAARFFKAVAYGSLAFAFPWFLSLCFAYDLVFKIVPARFTQSFTFYLLPFLAAGASGVISFLLTVVEKGRVVRWLLVPSLAFLAMASCFRLMNRTFWDFSENPLAPAHSQVRRLDASGSAPASLAIEKKPLPTAERDRKACDMGQALGCLNLGLAYSRGEGVARAEARAARLFGKACDLGQPKGCTDLGVRYAQGRGEAKDEAKADELFRKACDLGDGSGCYDLGARYELGAGMSKDEAMAVELYRKACDLGDGTGCYNLAGHGSHVPAAQRYAFVLKNYARAARLREKACRTGDAVSCRDLGLQCARGIGAAKAAPRAAQLFGKACELGDGLGCFDLAAAFEGGLGVAKDRAKALELCRRSCELDYAKGCLVLGARYACGDGVAKDLPKAETLYDRACVLGSSLGCARLKRVGGSGPKCHKME